MNPMKPDDLIRAHRAAVEVYLDISHIAASSYPELTDASREAYEVLPMLIDDCQREYDRIPEDLRPVHYLSTRRCA